LTVFWVPFFQLCIIVAVVAQHVSLTCVSIGKSPVTSKLRSLANRVLAKAAPQATRARAEEPVTMNRRLPDITG
jgi:hypothetical protein